MHLMYNLKPGFALVIQPWEPNFNPYTTKNSCSIMGENLMTHLKSIEDLISCSRLRLLEDLDHH